MLLVPTETCYFSNFIWHPLLPLLIFAINHVFYFFYFTGVNMMVIIVLNTTHRLGQLGWQQISSKRFCFIVAFCWSFMSSAHLLINSWESEYSLRHRWWWKFDNQWCRMIVYIHGNVPQVQKKGSKFQNFYRQLNLTRDCF